MSVMDIFKSVVGAGNATPTPVPDPAASTSANVLSNPTIPSASTPKSDGSLAAIPAAGEGDKSPLAEFENLWQAPDPKTAPASATELAINIQNDPTKLLEAARRVDFTKVITPELAARMQKGEQAAILEGMNAVSQAAFAQSVGVTGNLIKSALAQQAKVFEDRVMPEILRKHEARQSLTADNSKFYTSPAVTPLVDMLENQILQANPTMSASDVSKRAKEYLNGFATEFATASGKVMTDRPVEQVSKNGRGNMDWDTWVTG